MKVHYVKTNKDYDIAFFPESNRFFRINEKAKRIIEALIKNDSLEEIANREDESVGVIEHYSDIVNECINPFSCNSKTTNKTLNRLVIHLANGCNLRCMYCYANGGTYHSDQALITNETIDRIFTVFYEKFDFIETIQLFGGEPLMNMNAIEYVCQKVEEICKNQEQKTKVGLVTNGTLINDHFIEMVKRYNILVTLSYDGDKDVNDILRKDIYGNGTSNLILKNAKKLKDETGQPNTVEVTYTQYHYNHNITLIDIIKHIYNELGTIGIHCVPAGGSEGEEYILKEYDPMVKVIDDIFKANKLEPDRNYSYSFAQRVINGLALKSHGKSSICDAGDGTISVSVDGTIYPCFMLTDIDEYRLGNIYDENPLNSEKFIDIISLFSKVNSKNNEECINCFAKNLCSGCLGLNLMNTSRIDCLDKKYCNMFRQIVEEVLKKMSSK